MRKWLIIIFLIILGTGGSLMDMFFGGLKFRGQELEACRYSTGGGMLGGYREVMLKREKDGSVILRIREKETHADRERTTVYAADPAAFDVLRKLAEEHRLYAASKRPYSNEQILDGDTTSVSFDFSKDDFYVSENRVLSRKMRDGFWEVVRYLDSLAVGEGVSTLEPQTAMLYLKSGYTLQFIVEDIFDGRLDEILGTEREVSRFRDCGIVICEGETPDLSGAEPSESGAAGTIVYDSGSGKIIILYTDCEFDGPVYRLAGLDGYVSSACPLIEEMTGVYRLYLN